MFSGITKTVWIALALALVVSARAEQQKTPSLIGTSRDAIVARYGEPKSQLRAGSREVLFFAHLKLTLKNDVVTDVEEPADEPAPKRPPATDATAAGTTIAGQSQSSASAKSDPAPPPAPTADSPDATAKSAAPAAAAKPAGSEAEPQLEIKFIRQPSAGKTVRKVPPAETPVPAAPAHEVAPPVATGSVADDTKAASALAPKPSATSAAETSSAPPAPPTETPAVTEEPAAATAAVEPAPSNTQKSKAAAKRSLRRRLLENPAAEEAVTLFTTQSYLLAAVVIGCVAYLIWRLKQRGLELEATTVSRTPFAAPAADTSVLFTAQMLGKLEPARFEKLVAAYYAKTGVVAEPTGAGPDAAVHIKIFWKGEPKPFAGVQCHSNPPGLIPAKPLQDLFAALSAAEIRRGYVVTTGKFNVEARDFAEEKHFTLLPGDLLLEKLNALPPAARGELLQEASARESAPPADRGSAVFLP